MSTVVSYQLHESIATITMDDGKVNALSPSMLDQIGAALDRAESDRAVVVLSGRPGIFSAGFDLAVLGAGDDGAISMVRSGFELAERLLSFPLPVAIACTGHAMAMGSFMLLSGDYRVGAAGPYKFSANEVAIGLTMPRAALEILRQRLTPAAFTRAAILAETFTPQNAVEVGFVDRIVDPSEVAAVTRGIATAMAMLDMRAHSATKLRAREQTLTAIRAAIDTDVAAFRQPQE
ncbi:MAG: crotonase/enoyl-CoA hydratase family protein [Ilumatobacteraceae bacterium]